MSCVTGFAGARVLTGNDYEFGMMAEKLGVTEDELCRMVPVTVMTRGEQGSSIIVEGEEFIIPQRSLSGLPIPRERAMRFGPALSKGWSMGCPGQSSAGWPA